jgi:dihydroneopterin aldolase
MPNIEQKGVTCGCIDETSKQIGEMKIETSYIVLDEMKFFARHGVGEQEYVVGNEFTVWLRLLVDFAAAAETDELDGTVSYADVYRSVKCEMDIPSKLLEHLCTRIVRRLFTDFPTIEKVEIKLSKRNPPMGADIDSAGVEMCCSR